MYGFGAAKPSSIPPHLNISPSPDSCNSIISANWHRRRRRRHKKPLPHLQNLQHVPQIRHIAPSNLPEKPHQQMQFIQFIQFFAYCPNQKPAANHLFGD